MSQQLSPTDFIIPDEKRFVRSWVQTNENNQDLLDGYLGTQTLQTYTPVFDSVSGSDSPFPGDTAEIEGWWVQFYGIVYAWARVIWGGPNIDPGSGNNWFTFSLPVAVDPLLQDMQFPTGPNNTSRNPCIGEGVLRDDSDLSSSQTCAVQLNSASTVMLLTEHGMDQRAVRHNVPWTWADGDRISVLARYKGVF